MSEVFIGRREEKKILNKALESKDAELVAVLGRRRVGKTFLVRNTYKKALQFEMTGLQNANLQEQLEYFSNRLNIHFKPRIPIKIPQSWLEAFHLLTLNLEALDIQAKYVLFFDEFPWIATRKSGFLKAFTAFWNDWASQQNIVVVICGSAASWMIQKVVRDRGGLHNRITKRIHLAPFNLSESRDFLKSRDIHLDTYQIAQIYMAMGGIPHYLKEVEVGQSAAQNIERIFFSSSGLLREEFNLLYPALFDNAEKHIKVIRLLASKWQGYTRKEIIKLGKFSDGGTISKVLEELTHSGFIQTFYTFGKKKNHIRFRLMDEYSVFYLKFVEGKRIEERGMWEKLSQTQTYKIWCGYAFENLCLKHVPQIKKALGIGGIYSETSVYRNEKDSPGIQIDLIIDRNDHVINLLELKFYNSTFKLNAKYASELREKLETFRTQTKTRKQLFWTFLSTFGLQENEHSLGLIQQNLTMNILFESESGY